MQPGTFSSEQKFAFILLFLGFGILAAVWPFHTWSPIGHVAAPHAVSMVHAGVLMKIGAFGVLRVAIFLCPQGWQHWAQLMALLAAIGIVYGALAGLRQTDLKYVMDIPVCLTWELSVWGCQRSASMASTERFFRCLPME